MDADSLMQDRCSWPKFWRTSHAWKHVRRSVPAHRAYCGLDLRIGPDDRPFIAAPGLNRIQI